jgi:tetratricopeptide (TPR) repeat protein
LGLDLMEQEQVDDAYELAFRVPEVLAGRSHEYGKFLTWIGDALIKRPGRVQDGLKAYRAAVTHEPENVIVLNNLAWQLAAHPQATVRNGKEAVQWAEKAVTLTGQRDPAVLDTLAAAYAEAGDFQRAVAAATKAAALARQQGKRALWEGIQAGLAKFRQGQTVAD